MWQWLKTEAGFLHLPFYTLALVVVYLAWAGLLLSVGAIPQEMLPEGNMTIVLDTDLVLFLAASAFTEEVFFRVPILFAVRVLKKPFLVGLSIVVLSCTFGYLHHGVRSIPVQGVFGLLISVMFLKFGGANGKLWKPLLSTSFAHCMTNLAIFIISNRLAGGG